MPFLPPKPKAYEPFKLETPGLHHIFTVAPGNWMGGADLSALEARIIALLANDAPMLDCFRRGDDLHVLNARGLFGGLTIDQWKALPPGEANELRDLAKTFLYGGLCYGGSPNTIFEQIVKKKPKTTLSMVDNAIKAWLAEHPAILAWQQNQVAFARKHGYIEVPTMGTRHYFYGTIEPTICLNFPVQGFGAYIMKGIIKRVDKRVDWRKSAIILQVHDALYLEGPDPLELYTILKEEMERPVNLNGEILPMVADVGIGRDWGNLVKCKNKEKVLALARNGA